LDIKQNCNSSLAHYIPKHAGISLNKSQNVNHVNIRTGFTAFAGERYCEKKCTPTKGNFTIVSLFAAEKIIIKCTTATFAINLTDYKECRNST
jgi:hypothetical protein